MNKLTAEKCRQFIISMKSEQDRSQLSITGGYQLQALEIALPILDQQERGEWLHWNGERALPPVDSLAWVEVKRRNGRLYQRQAQDFAWLNQLVKSGIDIIAYRIIDTNQSGEQ